MRAAQSPHSSGPDGEHREDGGAKGKHAVRQQPDANLASVASLPAAAGLLRPKLQQHQRHTKVQQHAGSQAVQHTLRVPASG